MRSELIKSKLLVEQFQKAVKKVKDKGKEEFTEKHDKFKLTIEKDIEAKVMQVILDKLSYGIEEFEKKFKKMFPNYEVSCNSWLTY